MSDDFEVCVEGALLRVTLNRPAKRNALSRAALARLGEIFREHAAHDGLTLALLRGAGDRSFAAGGDLREFERLTTPDAARALYDLGHGALEAVRRFPVPVVAALNGTALGGGAELACACDLRIAAAGASMGFVQGTLNIPTGWGGAADLAALLGPARALRVLAEARVFDARTALAEGLVDAVAGDGEPFEAFVERTIAPWLRQRPQVMRAFKAQAMARKLGLARAEAIVADREHFTAAWCHDDHWRAARHVLDRGKRG